MLALKLHAAALITTVLVVRALFQSHLFDGLLFFYRGLVIIALATAIALLVALSWSRHRLRMNEVITTVALWGVLHIAFFVAVPVTLDRSLTIFMLREIHAAKTGLSEAEISTAIVDQYVVADGAVARRIHEQAISGNIARSADGRWELTLQGKKLLSVSQAVATIYQIAGYGHARP
jgi:hypothetical protein